MFFCALSITASRSFNLAKVFDGVLGRGLHRLAEPMRHRVEPLVDVAREFGLTAGDHVAHRLHEGAELDHALVGGRCSGRKLRVGHGRTRPHDEEPEGCDAQSNQKAGGDEKGGFHELSLRDSLPRPRRPLGILKRTNREHIDRPKSSP